MGADYFRNRRLFRLFLVCAVFISSFFGNACDMKARHYGDSPSTNFYYDSHEVIFDVQANSEEIFQPKSQLLLKGHLRQHRQAADFGGHGVIVNIIDLVFLLLFISVWNRDRILINSSYRFNIRFIHKKDGQKGIVFSSFSL